jgi:hypothetical protein
MVKRVIVMAGLIGLTTYLIKTFGADLKRYVRMIRM